MVRYNKHGISDKLPTSYSRMARDTHVIKTYQVLSNSNISFYHMCTVSVRHLHGGQGVFW